MENSLINNVIQFDNYLDTHKDLWCLYNSHDRKEDLNHNVSWSLQEGHSGPIATVYFNSLTGLFSVEINDHFYQFGNINSLLFSQIELDIMEEDNITFYHLTCKSSDTLIRFLFK